jgi:hypothetical protein
LAGNLNGGGHYTLLSTGHSTYCGSHDQLTSKRHVQDLERPAEERKITGGKDKSDHTGEGNGGRTRLFPLYRRVG